MRGLAFAVAAVMAFVTGAPAAAQQQPRVTIDKVSFPSGDGKTTLTGYVFKSAAAPAKAPAVVMIHGRSGAYSSRADTYEADTLSARHKAWGRLLARQGYVAMLIDEYGSVGFPGGFTIKELKNRPPELEDVVARPLHAYGALRYLRVRPDIDGQRVGVMGWSNGGSVTLAAMADDKPADMSKLGFKAAAAFYPSCTLRKRYQEQRYKPYAPVKVFIGSADKAVSVSTCQQLVDRSSRRNGKIEMTTYEGASHSFDVPTSTFQKVPENARARTESQAAVLAFFGEQLKAQ
ncbi:dienelactone hydrolase family protein [Sphingomonas sp. LY54]|uniref:dienelactone hydrolase family protein n=1 Tax=Sphingomonas sp. LY54 TaxID=3095343 RepID=UPI002D78FE10|nr:dienelactone hydrolase family protein [Sphingomonas sp. LY54]WRP29967.1 dienelactone hydrolase family protein [Sphingomonas sp. LY54]